MLELSMVFQRWGFRLWNWRGPTITGNCSTFDLRTNMKKSLLMASLVASVALAACGKKPEETVTPPAPVAAPAPAAASAADAGASAVAPAASAAAPAASQ